MGDVNAGTVKAQVTVEYDGSGIKQAKEDLQSLADIVGGQLGTNTDAITENLAGLDEQMGRNAQSAASFTSAVGAMEKPVESSDTAIADLTDTLDEHQRAAQEAAASHETLQNAAVETAALLEQSTPAIQAATERTAALQQQVDATNTSFVQAADPIAAQNELLPKYTENIQSASAGVDQYSGNWTTFQEALQNADPFDVVSQHLQDTGQTFEDFSASIGENATSELYAYNAGLENIGTSGAKVADTLKNVEPIDWSAEVGKVTGGAGGESWWSGEAGSIFGGGGLMGMLGDFMMPMFALQMIGAGISAIGTGIYNAAAIAEGPGAHAIGSFTGAVDTLNASVQKSGQSFSEGFGQGVLPALNGMNNVNQTSSGGVDWGSFGQGLGMELGLATDVGLIAAGGIAGGAARILTMNPDNQFGQGLITQGSEGLQNYWADWTGQPEPYPTLAPQQQIAPGFDQQLIDSYYGVGTSARDQAMYAVSHYTGTSGPADPMNAIIQYELDNANGGAVGMTNPDPNAAWSASFAPQQGCFPAGTLVLMADGSKKSIEALQMGEQVIACKSPMHTIITPILALIRPPAKPVYELVFSDGRTLTTTNSHPLAGVDGWKSLSPEATKLENFDLDVTTLNVGDRILTVDGSATLISITPLQGKVQVYNITVGEPHTFYAGGVLVHNKVYGASAPAGGGEFHWPSLPEFHWPTMPEFHFPTLPEIHWPSLPEIHWPSLPEMHWPSLPEIHWPSLPEIHWPSLPEIHWPSLPEIHWPSLDIHIPALPEIHWPSLPEIHWPELPEFHWPSLPTFQWPSFPQFQWPPMPSLSISLPAGLPFFASGVENFGGGLAVVGEQGPELVALPSGSSVYPMSAGSAVTGTSPVSGGGSSGPQTLNLTLQLGSETLMSAIGIPLSQNMRLTSGYRGY